MSNNKRLIQTIMVSGISVLIGYIINFVMTPYITENLGVEAYGFVQIANTAVSYAGIITVALTSFVVRYISVAYHEKKVKESKAYYSSSIEACVVLALVILAVAGIAIIWLDRLLHIPEELVESVKFLFVVVFINFAVVTITTPFGTAAYIKNRLDLTGILKIAAKVIEALVMVLLFVVLEPNVWFVAVGTLIANMIVLFSSMVMTNKLTPELKFEHSLASLKKIKDLVSNGIWNSLNQLGNVLNSGLDLIISNLMLTGTETGQIAVAKSIGTIFATLFQTVSQPFQPLLLKSYASGSKEEFLAEMSKAMKVCGFFAAAAFAGFVALGDLYFKLWLPSQDTVLLHVLTLLTVFNHITDSILRPVYYISTLTVKNKIPCWVTILGGLLNVAAMFLLLKHTGLGVYAVALTTLVIMVGINLLFNPIYAAKCISIKSSFFYAILFRHFLATAVLIAVFLAIEKLVSPIGWIGLICSALVMVCVGAVLYVFIMCNKKEWNSIIQKVLKAIAK